VGGCINKAGLDHAPDLGIAVSEFSVRQADDRGAQLCELLVGIQVAQEGPGAGHVPSGKSGQLLTKTPRLYSGLGQFVFQTVGLPAVKVEVEVQGRAIRRGGWVEDVEERPHPVRQALADSEDLFPA